MGLASSLQSNMVTFLRSSYMGEPAKSKDLFSEKMTARFNVCNAKKEQEELSCSNRDEFMKDLTTVAGLRHYIPRLVITFNQQDNNGITADIEQQVWLKGENGWHDVKSKGPRTAHVDEQSSTRVFSDFDAKIEETSNRAVKRGKEGKVDDGVLEMVQRAFFDFWFSVYQGDPASSIDCFAKEGFKAEFTINDKAVPGADNAEQYLAMAKKTSDALRWIQSFNLSVTSFSPKTNTMTVKYDQHLVVENKIEGKLVWLKMHSHGTENITYKLNEEKTQAVFTKIVCKETDEMEVMTPEEKEHLVNNIQEPETYSWWNPVGWFSK